MALCLANSLVARRGFVPYDQLVRYKWWYKLGYMSSTGECFDIGAATKNSIVEFERRQKDFAKKLGINLKDMDYLSDPEALKHFDVYCSEDGVAGNGALMRLAPVPLFFYKDPVAAVEFSGISGQITHGDRKAYDACRYYGALIVAALDNYTKDQLLDKEFYTKHKHWFGKKNLHPDIKSIAEGSYQKNGYDAGIRGKGYIVSALEAALWAFWSDGGSFEKGALAAVNLGDDTDTTAAIYGQLAGAYYGYRVLPEHWLKYVYAKKFMEKLGKWIVYEGKQWQPEKLNLVTDDSSSELQPDETIFNQFQKESDLTKHSSDTQAAGNSSKLPRDRKTTQSENNQSKKTLLNTSSISSTKKLSSLSTLASSPAQNNQNYSSQLSSEPMSTDMDVDSSVDRQSPSELSSQTQPRRPNEAMPSQQNTTGCTLF
jgi:ADP-ribosyl-[dinitrogen reductase] hydrolase